MNLTKKQKGQIYTSELSRAQACRDTEKNSKKRKYWDVFISGMQRGYHHTGDDDDDPRHLKLYNMIKSQNQDEKKLGFAYHDGYHMFVPRHKGRPPTGSMRLDCLSIPFELWERMENLLDLLPGETLPSIRRAAYENYCSQIEEQVRNGVVFSKNRIGKRPLCPAKYSSG